MFLDLYKRPNFITFGSVGSGRGVVTKVNEKTGNVTLDTSDIVEVTDAQYVTESEKAKIASVEQGATADQTGAEIKALYESQVDTNAFTDSDLSKLNAIESNATADQTGAEIKALYEAEANTNAFTDAEKSKLSGLEGSHFRGVFTGVGGLPSIGVAGDYADVDPGTGDDVARYIWDESDAGWVLSQSGNGSGGGGLSSSDAAKLASTDRNYKTLADLVSDPNVSLGETVRVVAETNLIDVANTIFEIVAAGSFTPNGATVVELTGSSLQAVALNPTFKDLADVLADTRPYAKVAVGARIEANGFLYLVVDQSETDFHFQSAGGVKLNAVASSDGCFNVRQFGAVGDGVTDDTAAFNLALKAEILKPIRDEYASSSTVVIPPTDAFYLITSDLVVQRTLKITGITPHSRGLGATVIKFADTCKAGFFFQAPGGFSAPSPYDTEIGSDAYGGSRSIICDLNIEPVNSGGVDFGIVHNTALILERIHAKNFRKAAYFAHGQSAGDSDYGDPNGTGGFGTMWGNTNTSFYQNCLARDTTEGHGFVAQGNNTQIMTYQNCDASGNRGCGFRDNSSIGNHYLNCHTAQNSIKVAHNGNFYMPIKPHTSAALNEPGVGAEWDEYWIEVVATISDEDWASGVAYSDAGGINIVDVSGNYPVITGHYTEGGIEYGVIPRGSACIIGGVAGGGRTYRGPDSENSRIIGTALSDTPAKWQNDNGTHEWGSQLGTSVHNPDLFSAGHTDDQDVTIPGLRGVSLKYSTVRHAYEWVKGTSVRMMSFTTDDWVKSPYAGEGHVFFENGILVGGPKTTRIRSAYSISNISGEVERGEVFILTGSSAGGKSLAYVTTAGTVGSTAVLKEAGSIDA